MVMKRLINYIKKFRFISYIVITTSMKKSGMEWEVIIPEVFLIIVLVELASRRGKKVDIRTEEGKKEAMKMVEEFTEDITKDE
jgi:hypothetical protein